MNVEIAEERILLLSDTIGAEQARDRAWAKRNEAFGAFARIGGLISRPKDEDYEVAYRELRLQPFWRIAASTTYIYERQRPHKLKVSTEVETVSIGGQSFPAANGVVTVTVTESCREGSQKDWLYDGLTRKGAPELKEYLSADSRAVTTEELNDKARTGVIVVPPQAKSSMLMREVISRAIRKIDADRVIEETMRIDAIDLMYRPIYAHRMKWQGKEAVVEVDAVSGATTIGGTTFEAYVGKLVDRDFLLDAGVEVANLFIPGANLAKIIVTKGVKLAKS